MRSTIVPWTTVGDVLFVLFSIFATSGRCRKLLPKGNGNDSQRQQNYSDWFCLGASATFHRVQEHLSFGWCRIKSVLACQ